VRRHILDGVTHVVGEVDGGEAVVSYSGHGVSVWRVQTGSKLQHFEVRSEQALGGVLTGHKGAFIVTACYSHVTRKTDVNVLSTETGLSLLSISVKREFEAVALSQDDGLLVVSSVTRVNWQQTTRSLFGFDVITRDVAFQLPVVDVHSEGTTTSLALALFLLQQCHLTDARLA